MINATYENSENNKILDLQYAATAAGGTAFVYGTGTLTTTAQWSCGASGFAVQSASVEVPLSTNNASGCTGATTAADLFGAVPTGAVTYLQVAVDMANASDYIVIHGVSSIAVRRTKGRPMRLMFFLLTLIFSGPAGAQFVGTSTRRRCRLGPWRRRWLRLALATQWESTCRLGGVTVYCNASPAVTTSTGFPITAGASYTFQPYNGPVYCIVASSTQTVYAGESY